MGGSDFVARNSAGGARVSRSCFLFGSSKFFEKNQEALAFLFEDANLMKPVGEMSRCSDLLPLIELGVPCDVHRFRMKIAFQYGIFLLKHRQFCVQTQSIPRESRLSRF